MGACPGTLSKSIRRLEFSVSRVPTRLTAVTVADAVAAGATRPAPGTARTRAGPTRLVLGLGERVAARFRSHDHSEARFHNLGFDPSKARFRSLGLLSHFRSSYCAASASLPRRASTPNGRAESRLDLDEVSSLLSLQLCTRRAVNFFLLGFVCLAAFLSRLAPAHSQPRAAFASGQGSFPKP